MSDKQLTVYEFAQKVKAKYPEYNDIDDVELAQKIIAKYPEYENIVTFEEPKKKEEPIPSASSVGESVSPEETPEVKQHKKSFLDYLSETSPIGTGPLDLSEGRVLRDQPTLMEVLKENPEYGNKMVNRSVAAAKTGILLAEADAGLRSVDFEEIADIQKVIQQNQPKEGDFFYNKNDGFVGFMYDLGRTLPESFISMGAAAETPLTAASVGTGAAAGTVVPGIGTAVGAAGGFAFATSAINEYGTTIMAMLDEEGIDITDSEELKKAFANEELIGNIKSKAAKRAGVIGLIDGISGGVAGKVSKKIVGEVGEEIIEQLAKGTAEEVIEQSSKAGRKILYKDVVETTVESLAGGTGEALGSLAAGQEISLRDVLLETLADPTSKIVSTGGSKAQSFMDGVSKNLEGSGNITEAQKSLLKLAKKDPKRFQDVVAASQYRNAGQIKQINAKIASLKESSEFGKDKSIDKLIGQLQRRKANLQMRTMSELRGADEAQLSQLSELGTEIEELNAKYSDGSLTGEAQQAVKDAINDKLEEFDAKYKEFGQDIEFSDRGDKAVDLDEEVKETEEVKIDREAFSEEDKTAVADLEEQLKTAVADKDTKKVQEVTNSIIEIENKYRDADVTEETAEALVEEAPVEETPVEETPKAEEPAVEEVAEEPAQEVDTEAVAVEENTIADAEFRIEDLNEEINIEKGNIKEVKEKAKEDTAAVRKSKLPKEEKAERIEEIKAELQDNIDEINGNIGIYKEDINALKSDIRKANKMIAKLTAVTKVKAPDVAKVKTPTEATVTKKLQAADQSVKKFGDTFTSVVENFGNLVAKLGGESVPIYVVDEATYKESTGKDSRGSFTTVDGKKAILVNADKATLGTVYHEMMHAYISSMKIPPKQTVSLANTLKSELRKGNAKEKQLANRLDAFQKEYIEREIYGKGLTMDDPNIAEEFLSEFVGQIKDGIDVNNMSLSTIDKIRLAVSKFINNILNDKIDTSPIQSRQEAFDFIENFLGALEGRTEVTAKEKVLDQTQPLTDSPIEISSTDIKTSRQQIKTEGTYIKESDLVDVKKLFSDFKNKNNREPKVWIWMSDQLKRGKYSNKNTGVTTDLEGGVGFAYDKVNKAKKVAWASGLSIKTLTERVAKADFIWFMAGSEKSSFNFSKGTTKTIIAEIEAGMSKLKGTSYNGIDIKDGRYDEFTNIALEILKDDKTKKWSEVKKALDKGADVVDHPLRAKIAGSLLNAGTTVKMNLPIHQFLHETLGVPRLNEFHDLIRDEFLKKNNYINGDMSLIIKPESVKGDANVHDTYPHAIIGEVIGMPNNKNYVLDVVPEESKTVISKKTGLPIENAGTPVMIKTAVGDVGAIYEGKDLSIARQQIDWESSEFGKGQVNPAIVNRTTPVQEAASDLLQGKITNAEYQEIVRITQPIEAITKFYLPASSKDMLEALDSNKGKLLNVELEDGTIVGLRLDIPAYKNRNIWIVSVHRKGASGKSLTYGSVAWATNVQFGSNPKIAAFIAAGKNMDTLEKQNKSTIARMHGEWKNFEGKTKEEKDAAAVKKVEEIVAIENSFPGEGRKGSPWRQIGMNPFRHSYFYDRRNGKPVVGASEVVQIGGLVYAKDVLYADRNDMTFEVSGYKDANGDPVRFQLELDDMDIQPSVYKKNIFQKIASQFVWTNIEKQARILFESKEGQVTLAVKNAREISRNLRRLAKDTETLDMISDYMEGVNRSGITDKLSKTDKGRRILDLLSDADAMVESFADQIVDDPAFESLAIELKFAITNNAGTYLKTRYRFFTDKKYKIKDKARAKAIQAERDMIVARQLAVLKKAGLSEEEIDQTIQDSLSDIDKQAHESIDLYINKLENIKQAPSVTGADIRIPSSSFQMKKDIPYHIQELLGVERDPVSRFSATIQAQANILYKGRMVQGLLDMSKGAWGDYILDSEPEPAKAPLYKFVKDPYSPLNGKYVHEEIMNIFDRKPLYESDKAWVQGYFSLLKLGRKSKVIWNIPTWRKNLTGGWYFMLANGVLANPRMYKDLKDRLALTVNSEMIMTDPQTKAWLEVMGKKGLLGANVDAQLIGINDAAYQYMYDGDDKAYKRAFKKVYSSLSNADKFLQEKYSAVDDYTKLVIFRQEVESFAMKIYGKEYESLTETQKDRVHDDAAEFVKQNTPTFSRLPKFYDKLAVIPILGDFVSFQFESIRSMSSNILNGVEDMKIAINGVDKNGNKLSEEQTKAYKASAGKRLVGTLSALALKYAMVEGFQQLFLDDDDEELAEDAKRVSPEWMKGQSLIVKSIKKNGDIRVYNYSSEDPYGTVGDLTSPAGWGSLVNTFVRPNIAADYIFRAVKGEDTYGRKLFDKSDTAVENALAFLGYTAKTFIVPPFISSSYRDVVSKNEKNAIDLFTDGETAKDLALTIAERSFMRDYKYNILDQFRYSVKDIASNKPLKDAGNLDKRYRHLESVREDFYAIKRIAIAKGNIKLAKDAQIIINRNFDKEERRFILRNRKSR